MDIGENNWNSGAAVSALFDWRPDIDRLESEVRDALSSGRGDPLTLGEIECSIDLIDAELFALRGGDSARVSTSAEMVALQAHRTRLTRLAAQLRPLVPDY